MKLSLYLCALLTYSNYKLPPTALPPAFIERTVFHLRPVKPPGIFANRSTVFFVDRIRTTPTSHQTATLTTNAVLVLLHPKTLNPPMLLYLH